MRKGGGSARSGLGVILGVLLGWTAVSVVIIRFFWGPGSQRTTNLIGFAGMACLTLFDLIALANWIRCSIRVQAAPGGAKKESLTKVQALVWGLVKLGCLGFLGITLKSWPPAASFGGLMGLSTLVVLPLGVGSVEAILYQRAR